MPHLAPLQLLLLIPLLLLVVVALVPEVQQPQLMGSARVLSHAMRSHGKVPPPQPRQLPRAPLLPHLMQALRAQWVQCVYAALKLWLALLLQLVLLLLLLPGAQRRLQQWQLQGSWVLLVKEHNHLTVPSALPLRQEKLKRHLRRKRQRHRRHACRPMGRSRSSSRAWRQALVLLLLLVSMVVLQLRFRALAWVCALMHP